MSVFKVTANLPHCPSLPAPLKIYKFVSKAPTLIYCDSTTRISHTMFLIFQRCSKILDATGSNVIARWNCCNTIDGEREREREREREHMNWFIHLAVCLTTGPKPLPKPAPRLVRSRASSFKWEYPLLSLRSSSSFLHLLLVFLSLLPAFYLSFNNPL
jgi:hypothetical protein